MESKWFDQVIALAGVTQAISTMDELAKTGFLQSAPFEVAVKSLFEQNPTSAESVFGDRYALEFGFETLVKILRNRRDKESTALIGYCLGIFHLQKRLIKNKPMLQSVADRLNQARHQVEHFGAAHENVVANLAEIYSSTISTFPFRIQVVGEYQYLQQQRVANQVRVLLLAAIRAATLWRQLGGTRWRLLLNKNSIADTSDDILRQIKAHKSY